MVGQMFDWKFHQTLLERQDKSRPAIIATVLLAKILVSTSVHKRFTTLEKSKHSLRHLHIVTIR